MGEHIRVSAVPGLFVIFPAWLQHYVVAHTGKSPRMSISFNVRLTFPSDDESETFVTSAVGSDGTAGPAATAPPKLSFTVPPHHQREFLDGQAAKDMLVS